MEWVGAGTCLEATFSQQAPHCNWEGSLRGFLWEASGDYAVLKAPPSPRCHPAASRPASARANQPTDAACLHRPVRGGRGGPHHATVLPVWGHGQHSLAHGVHRAA